MNNNRKPIQLKSLANAAIVCLGISCPVFADNDVVIDIPEPVPSVFTNTHPESLTAITVGGSTATVFATVGPRGYFDDRPFLSAFDWQNHAGEMISRGWTHNSTWLVFDGKKGQQVQLDIQAKAHGQDAPEFHPGFSLWSAPGYPNHVGGKDCEIGGIFPCVPAHLYPQLADWGWSDGGLISYTMPLVSAAFDADANGAGITIHPYLAKRAGRSDSVSGHLRSKKFDLPRTGKYLLVVSNVLEGDPSLLPAADASAEDRSFDVSLLNCKDDRAKKQNACTGNDK